MPNPNAQYADVTEVRQQMRKELKDMDTVLTNLLSAASRLIDVTCNRDDGWFIADTAAVAREFVGSGKTYMLIPECVSITSVSAKESGSDSSYTAWASDDWIAARGDPRRPQFGVAPYTLLIIAVSGAQTFFPNYPGDGAWWRRGMSAVSPTNNPTVQITAKWGHSVVVPPLIKEATIMQTTRWFKRLEGAMADSLANQQFGQLTYLKKLDPDIQLILENGRFMNPLYKA